jgi:amino acid transporter
MLLLQFLKSIRRHVNYALNLPKSNKSLDGAILIISIIVLLSARTSSVTGQEVVCPNAHETLPAIQLIPTATTIAIATTTVNGCATTIYSTAALPSNQSSTRPGIPGFPVASIVIGLIIGLTLCLILRRRATKD